MLIQDTKLIENRLKSLRGMLELWKVDGILIGSPANRRWLSGFTGTAGWLLVTAEKALLATDFRYWDQALQEARAFELYKIHNTWAKEWRQLVALAGIGSLGVESQHLSIHKYNEIQEKTDARLVVLKESVEDLREIKSESEAAAIKQAAAITDDAMMSAFKMIRPGITEREMAWNLEKEIRELGAQEIAFPIIVASGPNGAMAHHHPGDRELEVGDAIIIDMGARVDGYNSDLSRSFHLAGKSTDRFMRIYNLVLDAQDTALAGIKAGMTGNEADLLARSIITEGGYGPEFGHSLGHGIGLEVHENPRLSSKGKPIPLSPGAVVTVEPGIYIGDWGGVRIEDLVVVNDSGVEIISKCPKAPLIKGDWQ